MSVIQMKEKKLAKKQRELNSNIATEYTLTTDTIRNLGLFGCYPTEVLNLLLRASAYQYFKYINYPISFERFLPLYEENLTSKKIGATRYWYYEHELFAKSTIHNDLVNRIELFSL